MKKSKTILCILTFFISTIFVLIAKQKSFASIIPSSVPTVIDKRIRNLVYNESNIYELQFMLGYQSIIEFALDETIETIAVGEPYPWKITPIERRLFIKPTEPGVKTNMTVLTNRRVYYFEISSDYPSEDIDNDIVYVARFFYPEISIDKDKYSFQQFKDFIVNESEQKQLSAMNAFTPINPMSGQKGMQNVNDKGYDGSVRNPESFNPDKVNYNYSIEGDQYDFTPLEIFDDGSNTYLKFNDPSNLPSFYKIIENGTKQRISIVLTSDYIIARGIYDKIILEKEGSQNIIYKDPQ